MLSALKTQPDVTPVRFFVVHKDNLEEYTRSKTEFIQKVIDAARIEKGLPLQFQVG